MRSPEIEGFWFERFSSEERRKLFTRAGRPRIISDPNSLQVIFNEDRDVTVGRLLAKTILIWFKWRLGTRWEPIELAGELYVKD